jgi:hypothetical protein
MFPSPTSHVPHARPGQVWRWYPKEGDEFYHCVLLSHKAYDMHYDVWRILDLDTDNAGRVTEAYLFVGARDNDKARWEQVT